jgi:hypothetical protein
MEAQPNVQLNADIRAHLEELEPFVRHTRDKVS